MGLKAIWREDLVTSLLSTLLVAGLFLDGWNHINLQNGALGSFFTIWHALLYAGFGATALWVVTRNPQLYTRGVSAASRLDPNAAEPGARLPDDRLSHVRRRGSGDAPRAEAELRLSRFDLPAHDIPSRGGRRRSAGG